MASVAAGAVSALSLVMAWTLAFAFLPFLPLADELRDLLRALRAPTVAGLVLEFL